MSVNIRQERVERMLQELRYEIERGMIEGDLSETIAFRFYVLSSKTVPDGVVFCDFRTRPIRRSMMMPEEFEPKLKIVK